MAEPTLPTELDVARRLWVWFLALGAVMVVLGMIAISVPHLATAVAVLVLGWLLMIGGVVQLLNAFQVRLWSGFFLYLLGGLLNLVIGLLIVTHVPRAELALTLLLALLFLVGGTFRMISALVLQYRGCWWAVLGGGVTMLLGVLILAQWPSTAEWFIGLCVGIDLLFHGWSWVMFALAIRSAPPPGGPVGMPGDQPAGPGTV